MADLEPEPPLSQRPARLDWTLTHRWNSEENIEAYERWRNEFAQEFAAWPAEKQRDYLAKLAAYDAYGTGARQASWQNLIDEKPEK